MKRVWLALSFLCVIPSTPGTVGSHILGPGLRQRQIEVGLAHIWFHRDFNLSESKEFEWEDNTIFARYGPTDWLTVFADGAIWRQGATDKYPERDYQVFLFGIGMSCCFARPLGTPLTANAYYARTFWFDRSPSKYHKEVTSIAAALHIERTLYLRRVNITVWGGPAFVLDEYVEFPWGTSEEIEWESDHDLGVVAGLNLLIFDRVGLSSYAAYNGYIQPRITASYRY